MSNGPKLRPQPPKLRATPPKLDQGAALARLKALEEWSEEPARAQAESIAAPEGQGAASSDSSASPHSSDSSSSATSSLSAASNDSRPINASSHSKPKTASKPKPMGYPWEGIDEDSVTQFNIRVPRALFMRLKFLGETTFGSSMTEIGIRALQAEADKMLTERGIK